MASNAATLAGLENLLNEFFEASTSNERKQQIETLLKNFGLQEGAWQQCVYFLTNSSNYFVHMYSFSIFETMVNQKWHGVAGQDKQQIRKFLHEFLASKSKDVPPFIRNKSIKVIVNIGRLDWPMFYPMFFSNIIQLIRNTDTTLIGVTALQMVSEEFISPREDLSMTRRVDLKEALLQHIPNALLLLTELLNTILNKYKRIATTVTPPPSPNPHSPHHTPFHSPYQSPGHSPNHRYQAISPSPLQKQDILSPLLPMDVQSEELCICVFNCLTQYISWLPLSRFITPLLVTKIFNFAEYGCSVAVNGSDAAGNQVGIHAMNCINEILSKKFVPAEYETFLLQMFQQTFNLLQVITKGSSSMISNKILENMDESYLEKFTEFLNLFVGNHLKRFEPHAHFPTLELLTLLLKYTMVQKTPEMFISCLEIWTIFLDYLIDKVTACITTNFKAAAAEKYLPCLLDFLTELLLKFQFRHNHAWLSDLDLEKLDGDSETEWEKFLQPCLEVLEKLSELLPEETFSKCSHIFQQNLDVYFGLAAHINNNVLNVSGEDECQKLRTTLLDLSTLFRVMGRLSSLFTDEVNFQARFEQAQSLLERLIQGAMFGGYCKTYSLQTSQNYILHHLIEVHAQAIASVQAYSHWLIKFHNISSGESSLMEKFQSNIASALDSVVILFDPQVPVRIMLAAAHLLASVTTTIRPRFFLALAQAQKLYQESDDKLKQCNLDVKTLVYRALSNALVLPWPSLGDSLQEWEVRSSNHKNFISSICKELGGIPDQSVLCSEPEQKEKWKPIIKCTCHILSDIIESISGEGTKSRKIIYSSVESIIAVCSKLVATYVTDADVADKILNVLLVSVKNLKVQMGTAVVEEIISSLLGLLKRDAMLQIVKTGDASGINALDKFIKILEFIVQEPDAAFKKLLPSVITFAVEHINPVLNEHSVPDLKMELLELYHQLLLHNWRYFFKSTVISKMNGEDQLQHEDQFLAILKAFGQPLLETEIALFKKSIEVLESVNTKYHLYQKALFQSTMLSSFLQVLLNALIQKSHNLLQEEIVQAVHSMVCSNFDAFFAQFVPHFLMNLDGLTDHQKSQLHQNLQRHQDIPSFSSSLQQFIGDLRYCQIINSSLPTGTISL